MSKLNTITVTFEQCGHTQQKTSKALAGSGNVSASGLCSDCATIWTCDNCGVELTDTESDSHECAPVTRTRPRLPLHLAADGVTIVRPHPQADSEFARQQGYIVARVTFSTVDGEPSDESKAYAALIVKAVNNHQKLVDALRTVADHFGDQFALEREDARLYETVLDALADLKD